MFFSLISSVFAKTPIPSGYNNLEMYYRHKDIDRYLFQDHKKDLEVRGITVTHTGPVKDRIEIGIMPYTEENAQFLYKALGREGIVVVPSTQATLYVKDANETVEAFAPQSGTISEDVLTKYQEIALYVAENGKDLAKRGTRVTYVKPTASSVEVASYPYTKKTLPILEICLEANWRLARSRSQIITEVGSPQPSDIQVLGRTQREPSTSSRFAVSSQADWPLGLLFFQPKKQHNPPFIFAEADRTGLPLFIHVDWSNAPLNLETAAASGGTSSQSSSAKLSLERLARRGFSFA